MEIRHVEIACGNTLICGFRLVHVLQNFSPQVYLAVQLRQCATVLYFLVVECDDVITKVTRKTYLTSYELFNNLFVNFISCL